MSDWKTLNGEVPQGTKIIRSHPFHCYVDKQAVV